jgi:protein tyrosine phosphatase (PTP) superfamily phosphohydrolase (DUF442 family)
MEKITITIPKENLQKVRDALKNYDDELEAYCLTGAQWILVLLLGEEQVEKLELELPY